MAPSAATTGPPHEQYPMSSGTDPSTLLILDLDGTLADLGVRPEEVSALRTDLQELHCEHGVELPFKPLLEDMARAQELLQEAGVPEDQRRTIGRRAERLLVEMEVRGAGRVRALAGAEELLSWASRAPQVKVALVTSSGKATVTAALESLGWGTELFGAVVAREEVEESKPSPAPFLAAARGLDPDGECERVVCVGDHVFDLAAARGLAERSGRGVEAVAVRGGKCRTSDLMAAGPDLMAADLHHVLAWLRPPRFDLDLSMVIFGYNEEANVRPVLADTVEFYRRSVRSFEVVFVNDGSTDRTGELAEEFARENPEVKVVHHERNLGIGRAVRTGLAHATGEWMTIGPADGQVTAAAVSNFFPHAEHADIVLCRYRQRGEADAWHRLVLSNGLRGLTWALTGVGHPLAGAYLVRRELAAGLPLMSETFFINLELPIRAIRTGCRVAEATIEVQPRMSGESKVLGLGRTWKVFQELVKLGKELRLGG